MPSWLPIASTALNTLGGLFSGKSRADFDFQKAQEDLLRHRLSLSKEYEKRRAALEPEMLSGINISEITGIAPALMNTIRQNLKGFGSKLGGRFGVRSPNVTGAISTKAAQALSAQLGGLYSQGLSDRYARRRQVYGSYNTGV